jgi:hypothetical protein
MRVAYSAPEVHGLVAQSLYQRRWSCLDLFPPVARASRPNTAGLLFSKSIILYRLSEAGNEKYCYVLHARSGLRFIIRHDTAKLLSIPQLAPRPGRHKIPGPTPRSRLACRRRANEHKATLLFPMTSAVVWATWASSLSTLCTTITWWWCALGLASLPCDSPSFWAS